MKLRIDNETLAKGFFEDATLLGMVAPIKDYQLIFHINQKLGFHFRLNNNLEIQLKKKNRNYFFSVYNYQVPGTCTEHFLYNNQDDGEYLLPEFRHLDFLWISKGEGMTGEAIQTLQQSLKKLPGIQLVNEMTHEKIRNKQHLIL